MKHRELLSFIDRLREARTFEVAAQATLREMLNAAHAAFEESRYATQGRILRGMVHLRPADGYQRLVVLEHAPRRVGGGEGERAAHLPSATAWRWVARHQCAVSIDVLLGRVQLHRGEGAEEVAELGAGAGGPASHESLTRLMKREASHLYVVPLGGRRGVRDGRDGRDGRHRPNRRHRQDGQRRGRSSQQIACFTAVPPSFARGPCHVMPEAARACTQRARRALTAPLQRTPG